MFVTICITRMNWHKIGAICFFTKWGAYIQQVPVSRRPFFLRGIERSVSISAATINFIESAVIIVSLLLLFPLISIKYA